MNARVSQPTYRECVSCKQVKPLDAVHFCRRTERDGSYRARCRRCVNARVAARRAETMSHPIARRVPSDPAHIIKRVCALCHDMSWRVEGKRCQLCELEPSPEPTLDVMDFIKQYVEPRGLGG